MPAVTQPHHEPVTHASKKRRRDDHTEQPNMSSYEGLLWKNTSLTLHTTPGYPSNPCEEIQQRKDFSHDDFPARSSAIRYMPSPPLKRVKESTGEDKNAWPRLRSPRRSPTLSPTISHHHLTSPPREELRETDANSRPTPARQTSTLSRCHICHRKPTRKTDLDSFADCQGCGQRTCFVCLRECADWRTEEQKRWNGYGSASFAMRDADGVLVACGQERVDQLSERERKPQAVEDMGDKDQEFKTDRWASGGHRERICSRCCVERGPDGDVVCLGCLPFTEG